MRIRLRFRLFLLRKKSASIAFWYQNAACWENPDPNAASGWKVDNRSSAQPFAPRRGVRCADVCGFMGQPRIRAGLYHTNATSAHRAAQKNEGWHQASSRLTNRTKEMIHDIITQPNITRKTPSASVACARYHG